MLREIRIDHVVGGFRKPFVAVIIDDGADCKVLQPASHLAGLAMELPLHVLKAVRRQHRNFVGGVCTAADAFRLHEVCRESRSCMAIDPTSPSP